MAADDASPTTSRRLFVQEKASGKRFLIETGANLCVYPRSLLCSVPRKADYELSTANGTPIATYGTVMISLNLGLRRDFKWRFLIADVAKPILGADFLAYYNLLPDITNGRLYDPGFYDPARRWG
jgi:hypothetical protein